MINLIFINVSPQLEINCNNNPVYSMQTYNKITAKILSNQLFLPKYVYIQITKFIMQKK